MPIEYDSPTPLWRQLADLFRDDIASGKLPAGSRLPAESYLQQEHGLARGTVRKAMETLESEGLIIRVQGRGTFVKPQT